MVWYDYRNDFVRNNRGINDNADLPKEYLETLYDEIKERQIKVKYGRNRARYATGTNWCY